jgi:hypothetical protein
METVRAYRAKTAGYEITVRPSSMEWFVTVRDQTR